MSDDFIPLNQSTPFQQKWQPVRNRHQRYQNNGNHSLNTQNSYRRSSSYNRWGNNSRNSFSNSSNNSYGEDSRTNIDAYLHPSMLQDPWERHQNNHNHSQNAQNSYRQSSSYNRWGNKSQNSFSNSSNNSYGEDSRTNIDAYLHPSMLQDPWESLQQRNQSAGTSST